MTNYTTRPEVFKLLNATDTDGNPRLYNRFEAAGLGRAPFKCVGASREVYQAVPGDPNCPIQPGACCDYCGTAIYNVYHIVSADGRRFKVGCECVRHTGEAKIVVQVKAAEAKRRKKQTEARELRQIAAARVAWPFVVNHLAAQPHPKKWRADKGETLADSFVWWLTGRWVGRAAKAREARKLIKMLKA